MSTVTVVVRRYLPWLIAVPAWFLVMATAFSPLHPLRDEQARVVGMIALTGTLWGLMRRYAVLLLRPDRMYSSGFCDGMEAGMEARQKTSNRGGSDVADLGETRAGRARGQAS